MNISRIEKLIYDGDVSEDALRFLIGCKGECEWLDYKEELNLNIDKHAADFTKDVLAMKNVGGGFLVLGVVDKSWYPRGLSVPLSIDSKQVRDVVRKCSGLDLDIISVPHTLRMEGESRHFGLMLVRSSKKRSRRRVPSMMKKDFGSGKPFAIRRGEIYVRKNDETLRLDNEADLEDLLNDLEERADRDLLELSGNPSPFAIEDGTYRLLEKGFETFVGRKDLREQVTKAIDRDRRIWIINVHGPGGVGKSALVNWIAYDIYRRRSFEAILHLTGKETILTTGGIRRFTRSLCSLEDLVDQILDLFQESLAEDSAVKQKMAVEYLVAWKTLLILDNMETVNDARVIAFIQNLPEDSRSKVLLTSRLRTGGWEFAIPVNELSEDEMREFIATKCGELDLAPSLSQEDFKRLYDVTGGLPLAAQWLLGRCKMGEPLGGVLDAVRRPDSPVLEFSFRNIWNSLSADARAVLCVLTVFDAPPTQHSVCIAADWGSERVESAMQRLIDVTLVTKVARAEDGQFVFIALPITLAFAKNQSDELGEFELKCRQRVNRFNEQMALEKSEVWRFKTVFERHGIDSDNEKKAAILCNRGQSAMFSGHATEADSLFQQARGVCPNSAYVLAMCASYELARNRISQALEYATQACRQAKKQNGALAHAILARVYEVQGNQQKRADALGKAVEYDPSDVVLKHQYGVSLSRSGQTAEAIGVFSEIIELECKRATPTTTLLAALKTRIINFRRIGEDERAGVDLRHAQSLLREYSHLSDQAWHFQGLIDS